MSRVSVSAVRKKKSWLHYWTAKVFSRYSSFFHPVCVCRVHVHEWSSVDPGRKKCVLVNLCKSVLTSTLVLLIKSSIKYRFNWNSPSLGVGERERDRHGMVLQQDDVVWCRKSTQSINFLPPLHKRPQQSPGEDHLHCQWKLPVYTLGTQHIKLPVLLPRYNIHTLTTNGSCALELQFCRREAGVDSVPLQQTQPLINVFHDTRSSDKRH